MTTAEIIAIGTELLLGETIDTNTSHIARELRAVGVNLFRTQTIGDNNDRIASVMREALSRADIVITTGGLGPTVDDPTREAAGLATGRLLEFHPELWTQIIDRISKYGRVPTENQKKQAFLPQNALVIRNPVGTAPAFIIEIGDKSLICLPGVPKEMETLMHCSVLPYLTTHFALGEVIELRTLHISGMGEGAIDNVVGDLENLINPTVGLTAHSGIVSIRITAKGKSSKEALSMLDEIESQLHLRLGDNIFGKNTDTLEGVTLNQIHSKGWSLASLEYQADKGLISRLSGVLENAYRGGTTTPIFNQDFGCLLDQEMMEMSATIGLGLACVTNTDENKAHIYIHSPQGKKHVELIFGGHPEYFKIWAVNHALDALRRSSF